MQVLPSAYTVPPVPFGDRAITGTPLQILPGEPGEIVSPFPLRFAGGSFTTLFVDERGAAHFDGGGFQSDLTPYSEPLPSPYHSTLIAPFWDRIRPLTAGVGEVVWEVTGTAPNRELVVEWRNLERSDVFCELFGGYVTFQAVFFEGSSDILFNYRDTTFGGDCPDLDGGATATVGIQVSPDVATMFSFHTAALADGTSLLWTLGQAPQPAIGVTPASRDFGTVTVGASADATFAVKNVGTGTLTGRPRPRRRSASCPVARTRWPRGRPRSSPCASARRRPAPSSATSRSPVATILPDPCAESARRQDRRSRTSALPVGLRGSAWSSRAAISWAPRRSRSTAPRPHSPSTAALRSRSRCRRTPRAARSA